MDRKAAFGARVKAIRENRGYSQERLAELASLHRTYIGGVERGERNLSLVNIWRIADALGVSPCALFAATVETAARRSLPTRGGAPAPLKKENEWTRRRKR
jgi:transcriptional regulator with XRE-family HTH domain